MQHGYGGGQVRCWGFWNPRQHSTHMVKHDLPSMWLEESSALDGGERGTTIDPGATHIFTYFTRYLKAHFQTQLKSKIYVTTVNSYSIQRGQLLIPWRYSSHDTLKAGIKWCPYLYPWRSGEYCGDDDGFFNDDVMVDDDEVESHNNDDGNDKEDTSIDIYHPSV